MQTLFHRVAQVRASCRCPQCLHTAQGVSRRATGSATRQMPRYAISSTFWYSATFAVAATFDAASKAQRREKWDKAIEDVKRELGHEVGEQKQAKPETAGLLVEEGAHAGQPAKLRESADEKSFEVFTGDDAFRELEKNLDSSRRRRNKPRWPVSTQPGLEEIYLPPQSIYASDWRKSKADLRRWPAGKLEKVSLSTDILLMRYIQTLQKIGGWGEALQAVPTSFKDTLSMSFGTLENSIKQKKDDLLALKRHHDEASMLSVVPRSETDMPLTSYAVDDAGHFRDITYDLNRSLQRLFRECEKGALSLPAMLAKVTYNLATSTAPPNIDTYNTLIVGHTKLYHRIQHVNLQYLDPVNQTIRSLWRCGMRSNEVTISAMLNYYSTADMPKKFRRLVQQMRGEKCTLMYARPDIKITEAGASRLLELDPVDKEQQYSWRRVAQLPYPTPMVFGALVKGVLKFSGFDAALIVCQAMAHGGWGLCITGLNPLLMDCVERRDWTSGVAVWNQVRELKKKGKMLLRTEEPVPLSVFGSMLRLCTQCKQRSTFEKVLEQATAAYPGALQRLLKIVKSEKVIGSTIDYPELKAPETGQRPATSDDGLRRNKNPFDLERREVSFEEMKAPSPDVFSVVIENESTEHHTAPVEKDEPSEYISPADIQHAEEDGSSASGNYNPFRAHSADQRAPLQSNGTDVQLVDMVELYGHLPASEHLEEYEKRERPVDMHG